MVACPPQTPDAPAQDVTETTSLLSRADKEGKCGEEVTLDSWHTRFVDELCLQSFMYRRRRPLWPDTSFREVGLRQSRGHLLSLGSGSERGSKCL